MAIIHGQIGRVWPKSIKQLRIALGCSARSNILTAILLLCVSGTVNAGTVPPEINATVTPPPNAQGWHRNAATVTFNCSDTDSGVAICPDPVVVEQDGIGQPVIGIASDQAGNVAAAWMMVNMDTVAPQINGIVAPAANASGWHNTPPTVSFDCGDSGSGIASCPDSLVVSEQGAGQSIVGTAVDNADNQTQVGLSVSLDTQPPTISADIDPSPDANGWNDSAVTVTFVCADALSGVAECPTSVGLAETGEGQLVTGTAVDSAGNTASIEVFVNIRLDDENDVDGDGVPDASDVCPNTPAAEVAQVDTQGCSPSQLDGDADDDGYPDEIDAFPYDPSEWSDLDGDGIGDNADPDRDGDGVANEDDFFPDDPTASTVPEVVISQPANLITVGTSPLRVTGTIDDPTATLTLNGAEVVHSGGSFAADVVLEEGANTVIARAIDARGHEGIATISVSLDKTPPYVTVQSPLDGDTVYSSNVAVTGLVNDIVRGTVTDADAVVTVNGMPATVANRMFLAEGVPLTEGENEITVIASDGVGNVGSIIITVTYQPQVHRMMELVSGQSQENTINALVADPLVVRLTEDGVPVANKPVVYRVIQGDGLLAPGTDKQGNGVVVLTDADGLASTMFQLGSRAGQGNHLVRARAVGYEGEVLFHASASYGAGDKLGVIAGNNQRGAVRLPLPHPFVVAVTDFGSNLIPGAAVEFEVVKGGGKFADGTQVYRTTTDKDGRASAHLTLGPDEGLDMQRVNASLVGTNAVAGFTASGFVPGDPGQTSISGVVLDNQDNPLPGVTIRVDSINREAVADEQGQFEITGVPVGPVHLYADGSTTTVPGEWPTLSYNIVTVPGVNNPLATPIYLVELDTENAVYVGREDQSLTLEEVPGFEMKVKAGSVTFPDGRREGYLSVTPVNSNKIPMPPPNGMQPQFIVTIQPHGAKFDPPAELTLPNVDAHRPGAEVEMYSYDHDLEEFVTIGLGTVSKDGSVITSNPGVGIIKAGWHCGSQPGGSGCCSGGGGGGGCPICQKSKTNECNDSSCEPDDSQDPGQCKKCSGGAVVNDDSEDLGVECKECRDGVPANMDDGASCDDGLFCTSFDGKTPGPDQCKDGSCLGKKIEINKTSETITEVDFAKLRDLFNKGINVLKVVTQGSVTTEGVRLIAQKKEQNITECCETQKDMLETTAVEINGQVVAKTIKAESREVPIVVAGLPFSFQVIAQGSVRAKGYYTEIASTCSDPDQCNENLGGQVTGFIEGGVRANVLHSSILKVEGTGRAGVSGSLREKCGDVGFNMCGGPLTARLKVTTLSFLSYTAVKVFDVYHCFGDNLPTD